ncbi:MAG: hypothetical protein QOE77_1600 [Blastocatellia bacterium]|jgi:uncharacterized protein (DUF58 family)|nr:hypothetical protein [Blastocatellia bacterium]
MKRLTRSAQRPDSLIPPPSSLNKPTSSSFKKWRNAALAVLLILAGLGAAGITILARNSQNSRLAGAAAVASLIFAGLILILIVPSLARSAFAELSRFDSPVEVTAGGVIFICVVVIVGFAAWNTGNNLLFLVMSLLISTLFVSWMAARAALRELIVSARFPDHIFAGEPAEVIVTLRNAKRLLPSFSILVEARGPLPPKSEKRKRLRRRFKKRALAYFTYVPHHAAAEQKVEQTFPKRGHVLINGFELSTRFPFGFFRHRRRLRARDVDIAVYPKPEPVGDQLHLLPFNAGTLSSLRRGAGHDLFSLRDYQPQDDLRHIDWKATARVRRLTVREFTAEDERRITITLDTRLLDDIDKENFRIRFEQGVVLAASLVRHFIDERAEVRLALGEQRGNFGVGKKHLYDCLRRLALVEPHPGYAEVERWPHDTWPVLDATPYTSDANYFILLTTAVPGSVPSQIWRQAHVIYL